MAPTKEAAKKGKTDENSKGSKAAKTAAQVKGGVKKTKKKIKTSTTFRRPKTLKLPRKPKYPRKSIPNKPKLDQFEIIKFPLTTELGMKKIEEDNTMVFVVDKRANKPSIKRAVKQMYKVKAVKVNTLIAPNGQKKAYVRLPPEMDALGVASAMGIL
eukprot:Plantae.Rhodophyta-Purpureofilum_apyrenoidigerum.ctg14116.p2 GENE.Plantae.Rhodophyta-Purpureofilum_apyrenoidigerum.ctg14116~~Plantae.Rhodophyta-Purpureofilum_apyrenoidigerum.ctg14116.p2  ORF type:complete len:157 (-),score=55.53 Plantae.Rhodophyta-Purpureofilum_apyrenoidigerum.ctg14116:71-541(-)